MSEEMESEDRGSEEGHKEMGLGELEGKRESRGREGQREALRDLMDQERIDQESQGVKVWSWQKGALSGEIGFDK